jgi:hypothetical protein
MEEQLCQYYYCGLSPPSSPWVAWAIIWFASFIKLTTNDKPGAGSSQPGFFTNAIRSVRQSISCTT